MKSAFFSLPRTRVKRGKDEGPRDGVGNQRTPRSCAPRLYSSRRVSSLLAHSRKQEISLPVACLLVLMHFASQLFKLHARLSLNHGLQRLQERFSISLGEGPRLPQECLLSHLADGLFCSHERVLLLRLTPRWWPP